VFNFFTVNLAERNRKLLAEWIDFSGNPFVPSNISLVMRRIRNAIDALQNTPYRVNINLQDGQPTEYAFIIRWYIN
jgi:hypothetical protein